MTEPENFIARWSRRKREAAEETEAATDSSAVPSRSQAASDPAPAADEEGTTGGAPPASAAAPAEPAFDLSQLPSLDSITAETDIRGFLTPGVPADLARAALRRAWAADPKIRDFVGLAENAWDFNAPDAMAGFGPLEMTDDLRRLVSDMVGRSLAAEPPAVTAAGETPPLPIDSPTELPAEAARTLPDERSTTQAAQEEPATADDESRYRDEATQPRKVDIAAHHNSEKSEKDEVPQSIVGRPHGRALPK